MVSASAPDGGRMRRLHGIPAVAWSSLLGLVAVALLFLLVIVRDREDILAETEAHAKEQALVLADHAARLFDAAELALSAVIDESRDLAWPDVASSQPLWMRLRRLAEHLPYVEGFWLYGPDGRLRLTSLSFPAPGVEASTRDYFVVPRVGDGGVHVSTPVSTPDGRTTFRLSRRLDDTAGRFRGIASLTVDVEFFHRFYRSLELPPGSAISVLHADGLVPLVEHGAASLDTASISDRIAAAGQGGRFRTRSPGDGAERAHAYRRVPGYPLVIVVTTPLTALTDAWLERVAWRTPMAVGAAAALAAVAWLGFRQATRQHEFQAQLERRVGERTAELADANRQLEALVHEVHHRVNNNLQIIESLMALQAAQVRDPGGTAALRQSVGRIHTLSLVHQTLYGAGAMVELPLADYLGRLARDVGDLYGRTDLGVSVAAGGPILPLDALLPTALIVHEVLAGALEGEAPAGTVHLALGNDGPDGWSLTVAADSGALPSGDGLAGAIITSLAARIGAVVAFGARRFVLKGATG